MRHTYVCLLIALVSVVGIYLAVVISFTATFGARDNVDDDDTSVDLCDDTLCPVPDSGCFVYRCVEFDDDDTPTCVLVAPEGCTSAPTPPPAALIKREPNAALLSVEVGGDGDENCTDAATLNGIIQRVLDSAGIDQTQLGLTLAPLCTDK